MLAIILVKMKKKNIYQIISKSALKHTILSFLRWNEIILLMEDPFKVFLNFISIVNVEGLRETNAHWREEAACGGRLNNSKKKGMYLDRSYDLATLFRVLTKIVMGKILICKAKLHHFAGYIFQI